MKKMYALLVILLIIEFMISLLCGPYSCEWGNETYIYSGIGLLIVSFILPFFRKPWSTGKRIGVGLLFLLATFAVWVLGLMAGDFRILCKLF